MNRRAMIPKHTQTNQVALAWYTKQEWEKLRAAASDVDNIEETYDGWVAHARMALREAESAGLEVVKVVVRIDELVAWCKENGFAMDGRAPHALPLGRFNHRLKYLA